MSDSLFDTDVQKIELTVKDKKVEAFVLNRDTVYKAAGNDLFANKSFCGKASAQIGVSDGFAERVAHNNCEAPPISLEYYTTLYRRSAINRACIETKVNDIVGQGYSLKPRNELFPSPTNKKITEPNAAQEKKVRNFLDLTWKNGMSFTEVLKNMWRDVEVMGQGFIEFSRNKAGIIDGIYSVPGVTCWIAKGGSSNGYWQRRGDRWQYFANYNGEKRVKYALFSGKAEYDAEENYKFHVPTFDKAVETISLDQMKKVKRSPQAKNGEVEIVQANELLMFKKQTALDTDYGEPDILSAIEDYLIAQGVRLFTVSYFDNATVPRIMILVEGDTEITGETINKIESFLSSKEKYDVMQQSLLVQVPGDCQIKVEPLTDAHLTDNDAMLTLRDRSEGYIAAAHRVPYSAIPYLTGDGNRSENMEANERYLSSVVQTAQKDIEARFNWIFENELGVTDWVLDLDVPDLVDMKAKYDMWNIALGKGILSVNEVRKLINRSPVVGGDEPTILFPGQGLVPLSRVEEINNRMGTDEPRGDLMATGNTKTPPKSITPPDENSMVKIE